MYTQKNHEEMYSRLDDRRQKVIHDYSHFTHYLAEMGFNHDYWIYLAAKSSLKGLE